jgi:hypothetical protein
MKIKSIIRDQDMFGYKIELNFNKKGSTHKTLCGGLVSILVLTIMLIYVYSNVRKLYMEEDDTLKSIIKDLDHSKMEPVLLNETNFDLVFRITNSANMKVMNEMEYGRFFKVKAM